MVSCTPPQTNCTINYFQKKGEKSLKFRKYGRLWPIIEAPAAENGLYKNYRLLPPFYQLITTFTGKFTTFLPPGMVKAVNLGSKLPPLA